MVNENHDLSTLTPQQQTELYECVVNFYIQKEEIVILDSVDFSLELGNGLSILKMILKLTNQEYNFTAILK